LTPEEQKPGAKLPAGVATANSYVLDVFRVAGGQLQSYNFHATVEDEFAWNVAGAQPVDKLAKSDGWATEAEYLSLFKESTTRLAGDAPPALQATWRMSRDDQGAPGSEQRMLRQNYDPAAPRKFTRLMMLDAQGARALQAETVCTQYKYDWTNVMLQRRGEHLSTAFVALIEPYAGEPFIASARILPVAGNESDAERAVAVEVKLTDGRTDVLFADGRPDQPRQINLGGRVVQVQGQFASLRFGADGKLASATLTGGSRLALDGLALTGTPELTGTVVAVDYAHRTLTLDRPWPASVVGGVVELGTADRRTAYTVTAVDGARLTLNGSADLYRSEVTNVNPADGEASTALTYPFWNRRYLDRDLVASNEQQTKWWRAAALGGTRFKLTGAPVAAADFEPNDRLRFWEYGVGDIAHLTPSTCQTAGR
jgi:hypothetical protein